MSSAEDFHKWREEMGYSKKQVAEAGLRIGFTHDRSMRVSQGYVDLKPMDRLAMSAVLAGLDPWTPDMETAPALKEVHDLQTVIDELREEVASLRAKLDTTKMDFTATAEDGSKIKMTITPPVSA